MGSKAQEDVPNPLTLFEDATHSSDDGQDAELAGRAQVGAPVEGQVYDLAMVNLMGKGGGGRRPRKTIRIFTVSFVASRRYIVPP